MRNLTIVLLLLIIVGQSKRPLNVSRGYWPVTWRALLHSVNWINHDNRSSIESCFLQRVRIARNANRCNSQRNSVRPSVCPTVRHTLMFCPDEWIPSCGFQHQVGQVGQLSQTKRPATWTISGKNRPVNAKNVHWTSLCGAKDIFEMLNRLGVRINYRQCSNSIKCI